MPSLRGTNGDDKLTASVADMVIYGFAGNDTLVAFSGSNRFYGGDGNDTLTGAAHRDVLFGEAGDDSLTGGAGNDKLTGGTGTDRLIGGAGNDEYVLTDNLDTLTETGNNGTDRIVSSVTYTLAVNFEDLLLNGSAAINGTGNSTANVITGNAGANFLRGMAGKDRLVANGGNDSLDGGSGADTMLGGAGDDVYQVDNSADVAGELENSGFDVVLSTATYRLRANIENLVLINGSGGIGGTGNTLANYIKGNEGNNTLNGDLGADTLEGGAGNDILVVDNSADVIVEFANGGIDTIQSSITYTLGAQLENLTLTGSLALDGSGNAGANVIIGNGNANRLNGAAGNDMLDGGRGHDTLDGGLGDDTLMGGSGNDFYVVDSAGDQVLENGLAGTDSVRASISYVLGANVEHLVLDGAGANSGTGNGLDNSITGNNAGNVLDGGAGDDTLDGGLGGDTLIGGLGDDTFFVDNPGDVVAEDTGAGTDTIRASVSLALGANVERLALQEGAGDIDGFGNALANRLTGNSGANVLNGDLGDDTLIGGGGGDVLVGGAGTDALHVVGVSFVSVDGGDGLDSLRFDQAGAIDLGAWLGGANWIDNIESIDIDNGAANDLTLGKAVVAAIDCRVNNALSSPDLDNALIIRGEAGDRLNLFASDGWTLMSAISGHDVYAADGLKIAVDQDIAVTLA